MESSSIDTLVPLNVSTGAMISSIDRRFMMMNIYSSIHSAIINITDMRIRITDIISPTMNLPVSVTYRYRSKDV